MMEERIYKYTVKLTGYEEAFTFYDWDDVQCFIGYVAEGRCGEYIGFLVKMEEV